MLLCDGDHLFAFGDGHGQRLFADDVLAGGGDVFGHLRVKAVGSGDGDHFDVALFEHFAVIGEDAGDVVAIASPTPGNAAELAKRYNIPRVFTDYREMLKERDIEMVTIAAPNSLHAQMTKDIAAAGKHIVCEKPLAMTIAEGEEIIAV